LQVTETTVHRASYEERYVDALKKSLAAFEQQDQATADAAGKPGPGH
jgi:hypothetical protein